jgi:hypothetical protein
MPYVLSPLQVWIGSHLYLRLAPLRGCFQAFLRLANLQSSCDTNSSRPRRASDARWTAGRDGIAASHGPGPNSCRAILIAVFVLITGFVILEASCLSLAVDFWVRLLRHL